MSRVYCVPVERDSSYLLYAPDVRTAFVGNAALVNLLAAALDERIGTDSADSDGLRFLRDVGILGDTKRGSSEETTRQPAAIWISLRDLSLSDRFSDVSSLIVAHFRDDQTLAVTYDGAAAPNGAWDVARQVHEEIVGVCARRSMELQVRARVDETIADDHLTWILSIASEITMRSIGLPSESLPCRFNSVSFDLELIVEPQDIDDLADLVRRCITEQMPSRITVDTAWLMNGSETDAHETTSSLIDALRQAQRVGSNLGTEVGFRGAQLDRIVDFNGRDARSYVLSRGMLRIPASRVAHSHCQNCFANSMCIGDTEVTEFEGSERCVVVRELASDALLTAIERSGGIAWAGALDAA